MMRKLNFIFLLLIMAQAVLWGEVWEPFGLEGRWVKDLAINPRDTRIMYAIPGLEPWGKDLLKTTDGGKTWHSILGNIRTPSCIAIDPVNPKNVYVGGEKVVGRSKWGEITNGAVFKSKNGGEKWNEGKVLIPDPGVRVLQIVVHPADPEVLYLVRRRLNCGLHRSVDGGESWGMCSRQVNEVGGLFIEIDPRDPDVLYAWGTACWAFKLGKSDNGGGSFIELNLPGNPDVVDSLALAPSRPDTLYVKAIWYPWNTKDRKEKTHLFRSDDGGLTWEVLPDRPEFLERGNLKVNPKDPNLIYHQTHSGVSVSVDGGKSWQPLSKGLEGVRINKLIFDPRNPMILYACTNNGIYRTISSLDISPGRMKPTLWGYIRIQGALR